MELKNIDNFAILLHNEANDEKSIKGNILKISLRKQVHFNWAKVDEQNTAILYNPDKAYLFNMGANKKLKLIWKSEEDFYIIDFSKNTKGDILNYLTFEETKEGKIEGDIKYFNLKKEFNRASKVPLISSKLLDEQEPYTYEHFTIYIKNNIYEDAQNEF